jgi:carboxyl-terminal processing protease
MVLRLAVAARSKELLQSLDVFGDALERARSDYVDKPDDRKLIKGAIEGIVKLNLDFELDPATSKARSALENLMKGKDDIYAALDVFGGFLDDIWSKFGDRLSHEKMIEAAMTGMLATLDPLSTYIDARRYKAMQTQTRGEQGSIGIEVTMDNGAVKVVSPIEESPAAKGDLQPDDRITHIDGLTVAGLTLEEVIDKLRGPLNSAVTVTIERKGRDGPFDVKIVRDVIKINAVKARQEGDIIYVRISTFNEQTHKNLIKAVERLKKDVGRGLRGYVVDLRDNSGGLLDQVIAVADDFLDHGAIMMTRGRSGDETQQAHARPGDVTDGMPIVLLVDGRTAAGAEMVAAALKDNGRATVVGTKSSGNGTIQTIVPLGEKGAHGVLRLTTARMVRPSGLLLEGNGVVPDLEVAASEDRPPFGIKDVQLDAALRHIRAGKRQ